MSRKSEAGGIPDPVARPLLEFWSSYIEQANAATKVLIESFGRQEEPEAWQRKWFDAVSKSLDAYLRSPTFLEAMKRNTDAMIMAKKQIDELSKEFAGRATSPTAEHPSDLSQQLRSVETTILARLGRLEERIGRVEAELTDGGSTPSGKPKKKSKRKKSKPKAQS